MEKSKGVKQQYTCTKSVKAEPCDLYTAQKLIGRKFYKDDCENMRGYLVEYEDGYISWSPKSVFDKSYVLTETYVDRMKFEFAELHEHIVKATRALYSLGLMDSYKRMMLSKQLEHMQGYADVLYDRIVLSCPELAIKNEHSKICNDVAKGGSL